MTKVDRQAIKQKQQETQNEILSGVVDQESKTYTFKQRICMLDGYKEGTFTAKYLGVSARLRIGTIRAKLLDGAPSQSVDNLTDDIAYMIAYLTVALVKTPAWWDYDEIDNVEDLKNLYLEVYNFMQFFRLENDKNSNAGDSTAAPSEETVEDR